MTETALALPQAEIEEFCRRNQIRKLSLFGSVLTPHFRPESDIDVLVEFEPGSKITLFDVAGMELELTEKLGRNDLCPCNSGRKFQGLLHAHLGV